MSIDWNITLVVVALIAFNGPIAVAAWKFRKVTGLSEVIGADGKRRTAEKTKTGGTLTAMLQEKAPDGTPSGGLSYSRVTGLIGAVVVASLFWIMSNISIAVAILEPDQLAGILNGITKLFFVGAALFLPYAFNQLKALIQ
jgi:hypothetical protein